jgi:hypothetical protein
MYIKYYLRYLPSLRLEIHQTHPGTSYPMLTSFAIRTLLVMNCSFLIMLPGRSNVCYDTVWVDDGMGEMFQMWMGC